MKVQRGDVVLVDWLYSDRTGSKLRPAVVVQADQYNQSLDDTILALITRSPARFVGSPTQLLIDITTPDGRSSGLRQSSLVQCENLVTIDQDLIIRKIGELPASLLQRLAGCLKAVFDLP